MFSSLRKTASTPSYFLVMIPVIHQKLSALGVLLEMVWIATPSCQSFKDSLGIRGTRNGLETLKSICWYFFRYCLKLLEVNNSVIKLIVLFISSTQVLQNLMMLSCFSDISKWTSEYNLSSCWKDYNKSLISTWPHASSIPSTSSNALHTVSDALFPKNSLYPDSLWDAS